MRQLEYSLSLTCSQYQWPGRLQDRVHCIGTVTFRYDSRLVRLARLLPKVSELTLDRYSFWRLTLNPLAIAHWTMNRGHLVRCQTCVNYWGTRFKRTGVSTATVYLWFRTSRSMSIVHNEYSLTLSSNGGSHCVKSASRLGTNRRAQHERIRKEEI